MDVYSAGYHRLEVRLQMMKDGSVWSKEFKVSPLEEAKAIEIGADMLGEVVIFSVGAGLSVQSQLLLTTHMR